MYSVGLDVDTRAYFTSATCAISLYKPLRVYPPSKSFSNLTDKLSTSKAIKIWDKQIGITSINLKTRLKKTEKKYYSLSLNKIWHYNNYSKKKSD